MPVSKAQQKAVTKYMKENYDELKIRTPKGYKDAIKAHADSRRESVNGFVNRAIENQIERDKSKMILDEITQEYNERLMVDRAFDWAQKATQAEFQLQDKVYSFSDMFGDMIFAEGSSTFDYIKCQSKLSKTDKWIDDTVSLPYSIEYFSYGSFTYHVKDLGRAAGQFDRGNFSLSVAPEYLDDDSVILHEMIHLHEFVINLQPYFYRDAIFFCLYKDLSKKIVDLDQRIEAHGHILNSSSIAAIGGTHDILFLLKSFDLDLRKGYNLGTVFGYGMSKE